jgi:hypothetical protein
VGCGWAVKVREGLTKQKRRDVKYSRSLLEEYTIEAVVKYSSSLLETMQGRL